MQPAVIVDDLAVAHDADLAVAHDADPAVAHATDPAAQTQLV